MQASQKGTIGFILLTLTWMITLPGFRCYREGCNTVPFDVTRAINFRVEDVNGNSRLSPLGAMEPAPDSIKLKDLRTGQFYPLFIQSGPADTLISSGYNKTPPTIDSLVFYYGQAVPDTLLIYIGRVDAWRGDECGTVKDAGITKIFLRGQLLFETTTDESIFTIVK